MRTFSRRIICSLLVFLMILAAPAALAASGDTTVYRTKSGSRYHTSSCSSLSKSRIECTLTQAVYTYSLKPCSQCNPPRLDASDSGSSTGRGSAIQSVYIYNKKTNVFHYQGCPSIKQMNAKNKVEFRGTRAEAISMGYKPCGKCNP